jgi:cyclohexadieny/prephenate dehydrogenase / 3-phosphoshikimate 1-carboxyvinyltransferase
MTIINKLELMMNLPGDKSISHRALIFAAIADGDTHIKNFLVCEDTLSTLNALSELGVKIERNDDKVIVHGVGLHGLKPPKNSLYLGNSGTSMRLLAGLLAAQPFDAELTGDESLMRRPMARVVNPLRLMGANISMRDNNYAPLTIKGGQQLKGIHYGMPVASAQVKSALLIAGLYAEGETIVGEPSVTRDHTERMLAFFNLLSFPRERESSSKKITIPGDLSTAAFFIVAATLSTNKPLVLKNIGVNPTRMGVVNILKLMGADIELFNRCETYEPVADIKVKPAKLQGITVPLDQISLAIDELPIVMIAAAKAQGKTIIRGAQELRVKESDRLAAMAEGLKQLGIVVEEFPDGIDITAGEFLHSANINTHGDHRIAMAFAVANTLAGVDIRLEDPGCVNVSCPHFFDLLSTCEAY